MKIKPLILLVIFLSSIFPQAKASENSNATCPHQITEKYHRETKSQSKDLKDTIAPCCSQTKKTSHESKDKKGDKKDKDCCGDDCDCSCCLHIAPVSITILDGRPSIVTMPVVFMTKEVLFGYADLFDQGFSGTLLQPPKF